jgi:trehalose/maltose hydrolase-like predicted phosphorylase
LPTRPNAILITLQGTQNPGIKHHAKSQKCQRTSPQPPTGWNRYHFNLNFQHSEFQVTRPKNKNRFAKNEHCSLSLGYKHKNDE